MHKGRTSSLECDWRLSTHLGHPLRTDIAASLNVLQASFVQTVDELYLQLGCYDRLLILETVAGTDFDNPESSRNGEVWIWACHPPGRRGQASD